MNIKIALAAACMIGAASINPASAEYLVYGMGSMSCGEALNTFKGALGDYAMLGWVGGYVSGLNAAFPKGDDASNSEELVNLVKMIKITCKAHKIYTFEKATILVLARIQAQANDQGDDVDNDRTAKPTTNGATPK